MEKSEKIINISKALITFQGKVDKIKKDTTNPFFKSKYASLSSIQDEIQLPLAESGLCYTQHPENGGSLTTMLVHADSGEYFQSSYDMHLAKSDPQSLGSAITYAKRYALVANLGLNIDDDDDGNHASGRGTECKESNPEALTRQNGAQVDNRVWLNQNTKEWTEAVKYLQSDGGSLAKIETKYKLSKANKEKLIEEAQAVLS